MYHVITGGCNTWHPQSFQMSRPNGNPNYVLLIIKTHCLFTLDGVVHKIAPATAILLDRDIPYSYYNPQGIYMDDWFHFTVDDDAAFRASCIPLNCFFPVPNIHSLTAYLNEIFYENRYSPEAYRQTNIDCLIRVLLNNLTFAYTQRNSWSPSSIHCEALKEIRLLIEQAPNHREITIANAAEKVGISISHFQHLYTELFGISFQKDLIRMKVNYGAGLLLTTDWSVEAVAQASGYTSPVHFYRQFRAQFGMTPKQYRDENGHR